MSETTSIGVRVTSELEERIRKLAESRPDGIQLTRSQVIRAALEVGLGHMEQSVERWKGDE